MKEIVCIYGEREREREEVEEERLFLGIYIGLCLFSTHNFFFRICVWKLKNNILL